MSGSLGRRGALRGLGALLVASAAHGEAFADGQPTGTLDQELLAQLSPLSAARQLAGSPALSALSILNFSRTVRTNLSPNGDGFASNGPLNAGDVAQLANIVGGRVDDWHTANSPDINFDALANNTGLVLQTLGAALGPVYPAAGVALTIAGIWAEPALKYSDAAAAALLPNPLPLTSPEQAEAVFQTFLEQAATGAKSNPQIGMLLNSEDFRKLGLSSDRSPNDIIDGLPLAARGHVVSALRNSRKGQDKQSETELETETYQAIDSYSSDSRKAAAQITATQEIKRRQQLAKALRDQLNFQSNEVTGAIQIASLLITHAFGDQASGLQFFQAGMALKSGWDAIAQYSIGQIGILGFSGGLLTSAATLSQVFGTSAPDPVIAGIAEIQQALKQIQGQLDVISQKDDVIIQGLRDLYNMLLRDQARTDSQLARIQGLLTTVAINQDRDQRILQEQAFFTLLSSGREAVRANDTRGITDALRGIHDYTVNTTKLAYYCYGDATPFGRLIESLKDSNRSDLYFGALPRIWAWAGLSYQSPLLVSQSRPVSNPIAWAQGARAYLQLRTLSGINEAPSDKPHLEEIWNEGIRIREAALISSSSKLRSRLSDMYEEVSGCNLSIGEHNDPRNDEIGKSSTVIGLIYRVCKQFEDQNTYHGWSMRAINSQQERASDVWDSYKYPQVFAVEGNPIWILLSQGFLENRFRFAERAAFGQSLSHSRLYGSAKMPECFRGNDIFGTDLVHFNNPRANNPDSFFWADHQPTIARFNYATSMVRTFIDLPRMQSELPNHLTAALSDLGNRELIEDFENIGAIAQLSVAIENWRAMPTTFPVQMSARVEEPRDALVRGAMTTLPGIHRIGSFDLVPKTGEDLCSFIGSVLSRMPHDAVTVGESPPFDRCNQPSQWFTNTWYDWAINITRNTLSRMEQTASHLRSESAQLVDERGIPEIDSALKQLAGYWKLRGWPDIAIPRTKTPT